MKTVLLVLLAIAASLGIGWIICVTIDGFEPTPNWEKEFKKLMPKDKTFEESMGRGGHRSTSDTQCERLEYDMNMSDVKTLIGKPLKSVKAVRFFEEHGRPEVNTIHIYKDFALVESNLSAKPGNVILIMKRLWRWPQDYLR